MITYYLTTKKGTFITVFADKYEIERTTIFFYLNHALTVCISINDLYTIERIRNRETIILWTNKKGRA